MSETLASVCTCVASVFQVAPDAIDVHDSQDTIADWDSAGQIQLVLELEACFGVSFSLEEILQIRSVGDIVQLVDGKQQPRG